MATQNIFSAAFTGVYDFGIAANVKQTVLEMSPGITYFVDNFSFAGNISQEDFLSAVSTTPYMIMSRKNDGDRIFTKTLPLNQFASQKPATVFISSNKKNDYLLLTLSGLLNQTANLVGVDPVVFTVSFSVYAIDNNDFNRELQNTLSPDFAKRINR